MSNMDTFDMIQILQSAASQWADYLEESKKYGYGNLETDLEIANVRDALTCSDQFLESIKDLVPLVDAKRVMSSVMKIVENLG